MINKFNSFGNYQTGTDERDFEKTIKRNADTSSPLEINVPTSDYERATSATNMDFRIPSSGPSCPQDVRLSALAQPTNVKHVSTENKYSPYSTQLLMHSQSTVYESYNLFSRTDVNATLYTPLTARDSAHAHMQMPVGPNDGVANPEITSVNSGSDACRCWYSTYGKRLRAEYLRHDTLHYCQYKQCSTTVSGIKTLLSFTPKTLGNPRSK